MSAHIGLHLRGITTLPVTDVTPDQVAAAKRVVLKHADDWIEASNFMAMLGLEAS